MSRLSEGCSEVANADNFGSWKMVNRAIYKYNNNKDLQAYEAVPASRAGAD